MASELLTAYTELRDSGKGHVGAVRRISRDYGFDTRTVERVLRRALDDQRRLARRSTTPQEEDHHDG